jgi:predicted kinase
MMQLPLRPDFDVPWDDLDRSFAWVRRLRDCPQDPQHHAEGDVWTHTRMVCEAMAADSTWRALSETDRRVTWLSALLHDVAKPECTGTDLDGRIHARGHSQRGSVMARAILWRLLLPFEERERICALVARHQLPFWLLERGDPLAPALAVSVATRCSDLAMLAEADARGRRCLDQRKLLDAVELFRTFCDEQGCLERRWAFPSDHSRFRYFQRPGSDPSHHAHESFRCEVVVMSGLPGAGKDRWIAEHLPGWPVVSLDELRGELDVEPTDNQGTVIQAARERAREHLRAGRSFVWSATNLSRALRSQTIRLAADYDARVRVVYVEAPPDVLFRQNAQRARPVPEAVIERLLDRWEVPDATEAHEVLHVVAPPPKSGATSG